MTTFIFLGDLLVMLFMVLLVIWVTCYESEENLDSAARIPLEDETREG